MKTIEHSIIDVKTEHSYAIMPFSYYTWHHTFYVLCGPKKVLLLFLHNLPVLLNIQILLDSATTDMRQYSIFYSSLLSAQICQRYCKKGGNFLWPTVYKLVHVHVLTD